FSGAPLAPHGVAPSVASAHTVAPSGGGTLAVSALVQPGRAAGDFLFGHTPCSKSLVRFAAGGSPRFVSPPSRIAGGFPSSMARRFAASLVHWVVAAFWRAALSVSVFALEWSKSVGRPRRDSRVC